MSRAPAPEHPLARLFRAARPWRARIAAATACSILNKLLDLAPPVLIGLAVDTVVRGEQAAMAGLGFAGQREQLLALAGLTVLIWVLESVFEYLFDRLWRGLAQEIQHHLRSEAFAHAQGLELGFFEQNSTGGLLAILNDDVNQLERFLDRGANDILQVATTVLAIAAAFFWIAPQVAWMALLPMPFILWGTFRFQRLLAPRYAAVRAAVGRLSGDLAANLSGIATVQAFRAEASEAERIGAASAAYVEANRAAIRLSAAYVPLIRMLVLAGFLAILLWAGFACIDGRLEVGAYSTMLFLTQRLLWPLTRLGETLDLYQRAMASSLRLFGLLDRAPAIRSGSARLSRPVRGHVRFEGVHFAYSGRPPTFDGLDLELPPGRTTALVGVTGAGKTTLVKLLLRHVDPQRGRILFEGMPLDGLDLADLRGAIGLVAQDVFVFDGSVRANIALGRPAADLDQVRAAARAAEIDTFVESLPEGYETAIGERGQRLSGGQRQRLSIARAILVEPPLLVLDEATSAVDNETEAAIQRSLARISRGRTTLVIAHRLSTVRHAHQIAVLAGGRVAEQGTHESLLAKDGLYAALWRVQTGEVAVESPA